MLNITEWAWVFNNTFVVCRNVDNKIVVEIERTGNVRTGLLYDMPMELFGKIAELGYEEKFLEQLAKSAEDEFLKTYLGEI